MAVAPEADYRLEFLPPGSIRAQGSFARFQVLTAPGPLGPSNCASPAATTSSTPPPPLPSPTSSESARKKSPRASATSAASTAASSIRGAARGVAVVDDYGHHPTEIRATLAAARECGYQRIHVVFQPHRFSRTKDLLDEFARPFVDADTVIVLPIYAASEEPIPGVTADASPSKSRPASSNSLSISPDFPPPRLPPRPSKATSSSPWAQATSAS